MLFHQKILQLHQKIILSLVTLPYTGQLQVKFILMGLQVKDLLYVTQEPMPLLKVLEITVLNI